MAIPWKTHQLQSGETQQTHSEHHHIELITVQIYLRFLNYVDCLFVDVFVVKIVWEMVFNFDFVGLFCSLFFSLSPSDFSGGGGGGSFPNHENKKKNNNANGETRGYCPRMFSSAGGHTLVLHWFVKFTLLLGFIKGRSCDYIIYEFISWWDRIDLRDISLLCKENTTRRRRLLLLLLAHRRWQ